MSAGPIFTIQSGQASELDFDVQISGASKTEEPTVRFVIEGVGGGYDLAINCSKTPKDSWNVKFPSHDFAEEARNFRIEVVTEGYYFCPVGGEMAITHTPRVSVGESFQPIAAKPASGRPQVTSSLPAKVTEALRPARKLLEFRAMSPASRSEAVKHCQSTGRIMIKAGEILCNIFENQDQSKHSTKALVALLATVQKSVAAIELRVYI